MTFQTRCLSSLSKVFTDRELVDKEYKCGSALRGEVFSFQVAFHSSAYIKDLVVTLQSELNIYSQLRYVESLPARFLGVEFDNNVIQQTPGLFPELLSKFDTINLPPNQWHSVWISVRIPESIRPDSYKFNITFSSESEEKLVYNAHFSLKICNAVLPKSQLIMTNWLHPDCIMTHYNTTAWSNTHWELLEKYMTNAVNHGSNMILTPLFTLPLDTEVGGKRPTTQLVKVFLNNGKYDFDFSLLVRWIKTASDSGFEYLEMSHLFTQWGAEKTPLIMADVDGEYKQIFGWDVPADSSEYRNFIAAFLPALTNFLKRNNLQEKTYFHISDEPEAKHLDSFKTAASIVKPYLKGFNSIDALSDIDFYRKGIVQTPVPSIDKIDIFKEEGVSPLWCYYCSGPQKYYSNRFFHFPSAKNRILGMQLYRNNVAGFLHWGFNFWYSQFSKRQLNPFQETDAGKAFPSGDACVVYPGPNGPIDSLRWEVFYEGIQDLAACRLLEEKIGRENAINIIEPDFGQLSMTHFPKDIQWLLDKRAQINDLASISYRSKKDYISNIRIKHSGKNLVKAEIL